MARKRTHGQAFNPGENEDDEDIQNLLPDEEPEDSSNESDQEPDNEEDALGIDLPDELEPDEITGPQPGRSNATFFQREDNSGAPPNTIKSIVNDLENEEETPSDSSNPEHSNDGDEDETQEPERKKPRFNP